MNTIESTVSEWPGIEVEPHDCGGGHEFDLDGREIGHVHPSRLVDIPFAKRVRDIIIPEGRAEKHHVYPESGWISYHVQSDDDIDGALWLLRVSYLYHLVTTQNREGNPEIDAIDIDAALDELDMSDELCDVFSDVRADQ